MAKARHELDNCTCLNLRMAARSVTQFYDNVLRGKGLRGTQFSVLATIGESEPVTITHLASGLKMDRTTLTRDLRPLERRGLVSIAKGRDRRTRMLSLTDDGRKVLWSALPAWREAQDTMFGAMGKKDWRRLLKNLQRATEAARVDRTAGS